MTAATRSETALVRPYAGIAQADISLAHVQLQLAGREYPPGPVVLPEEELAKAEFTVLLPSPSEVRAQVDKTVLPAVDCGLVVMATARTNRASTVFIQDYLRTGDWPTEFRLKRNHADLVLNDVGGFVLTVAVVLLNDLAPEPLRPSMAGTWLARRDFTIGPEVDETSFSPEELTDEVRQFHNLPPGVLRYVHVDDVLDEEILSDAVHVYVDPEVLHLLHANPSDVTAVQMQTELAILATETLAVAIVDDLSVGGAVVTPDAVAPYPAASKFYQNLARTLDVSLADLLDMASSKAPVLRARLEAAFDLRAVTSAMLKEK